MWCYDHLSGAAPRRPQPRRVGGLGAVATATAQVSVGPLVANVTAPSGPARRRRGHDPVAVGRTAQAGLGAGAGPGSPFAVELEMFQLVPGCGRAPRRLEEVVAFLRPLGGAERFDGRWAAFSDVRGVNLPSPVPPIILGANGQRLAEVAGRVADGVNFPRPRRTCLGSWRPSAERPRKPDGRRRR